MPVLPPFPIPFAPSSAPLSFVGAVFGRLCEAIRGLARRESCPASRFVVLAVTCGTIDALLKAGMLIWLTPAGAPAPQLPGLVALELVENPRGVLEACMGLPSDPIVIASGVFLLALAFGYLVLRDPRRTEAGLMAAAAVCGGGLGNLLQRLVQGTVTDYLRLGEGPVTNLADLMILAGILYLALIGELLPGARGSAPAGKARRHAPAAPPPRHATR